MRGRAYELRVRPVSLFAAVTEQAQAAAVLRVGEDGEHRVAPLGERGAASCRQVDDPFIFLNVLGENRRRAAADGTLVKMRSLKEVAG